MRTKKKTKSKTKTTIGTTNWRSKSGLPLQPIAIDKAGTPRFRENKIVTFLLDHGGYDMNKLAVMEFSKEDREQFAQLIGYSVGGFNELSYVSDEAAVEANRIVNDLLEAQ